MSVEELDTHPRAPRGQAPPRAGPHAAGVPPAAGAYELDAAVGPDPGSPPAPPPFRVRLGAGLAWARAHRRQTLRALALLLVGALLGAGVAGERAQAREQAARENVVDVVLAGVGGDGSSGPDPSAEAGEQRADVGTASLDLRNTGPLPVQVVGARVEGDPGVRFTGVQGAALQPDEVSGVLLSAELDCTRLADVSEIRIVLQVRAPDGSVHDARVEAGVPGAIGPWSFGWCDDTSIGREVDVRYDGAVPTPPRAGVFRMALTLTSRDTEVLDVRGVDSPFPSAAPLSGLQAPTSLPPARPVPVAVQFDLPACELVDSFAVPESVQLYVVPSGTELTASSSPTVYAPVGTRFQRDLLAAIDRRCPRPGAGLTPAG